MVNKVIIVGNLGKDPEVRSTQSGASVCSFPVATSEQWNDKQGNKQERTEWHNVVVWGKQAEACGQYIAKGRSVFVEGSIRTEEYEKDGQKRYATKIIARDVRFLGGGSGQGNSPGRSAGDKHMLAGNYDPNDIPF